MEYRGNKKEKEVFPFQQEDLERIRAYFKKRNKVVISALINIGVNVALRYSDLSRLCFEDIREDNTICILEQKTRKKREFKLNGVCRKELQNLREYYSSLGISPTGYLFKSLRRSYIKSKQDHPLSIRSFNRYLKEGERELCLKYSIGSHSLRKTWGYFYYQSTQDIGMVMKILNHSSMNTTLRYLGINRENIYHMYENFTI